ncbi:hypothetical protein K2173_022436 [Erythroxylum novogranatense]|uniref:Uncharacterized protein n=1 Tax=Erythroxylum novogranatense TaxID=1862640 RepID=A0AAV8THK3_9ROSI|nr:hypothetical protein K2173_022436 [Erythroxylum novogranatense]
MVKHIVALSESERPCFFNKEMRASSSVAAIPDTSISETTVAVLAKSTFRANVNCLEKDPYELMTRLCLDRSAHKYEIP